MSETKYEEAKRAYHNESTYANFEHMMQVRRRQGVKLTFEYLTPAEAVNRWKAGGARYPTLRELVVIHWEQSGNFPEPIAQYFIGGTYLFDKTKEKFKVDNQYVFHPSKIPERDFNSISERTFTLGSYDEREVLGETLELDYHMLDFIGMENMPLRIAPCPREGTGNATSLLVRLTNQHPNRIIVTNDMLHVVELPLRNILVPHENNLWTPTGEHPQ